MNKKTVALLSVTFLISPVFIQPAANSFKQLFSYFARAASTASSSLFHDQQTLTPENDIVMPTPTTDPARTFNQQQERQNPVLHQTTRSISKHAPIADHRQTNRLINRQTQESVATDHSQELCRQGAQAIALLNLQHSISGLTIPTSSSAIRADQNNTEEQADEVKPEKITLSEKSTGLQKTPTLSPSELLALAFQAAPTQQKPCRIYTITPPALQPACIALGSEQKSASYQAPAPTIDSINIPAAPEEGTSSCPSEPTQQIVKTDALKNTVTQDTNNCSFFLTDQDLMKAFERLNHALTKTCNFDGHTPLTITTEKITATETDCVSSDNSNAVTASSCPASIPPAQDTATTMMPYNQPTTTTPSTELKTTSKLEQTIKITLTAGSAVFTFFIAAKNLSSKQGLLRTLKTVEKAVRAGMPATPAVTKSSASTPAIKSPVAFKQPMTQVQKSPTNMHSHFNTYTHKHPLHTPTNGSAQRSTFSHLFENNAPFNHTQRRFSTNNPVVIEQQPARLALEGPTPHLLESGPHAPAPRPVNPSLPTPEQTHVSLPTRIHEPTIRTPEAPKSIQPTQANPHASRPTPAPRNSIVTNPPNALVPSSAQPTALVPSPTRTTTLVASPARPTAPVPAPRRIQPATTPTRANRPSPTTPSAGPVPTARPRTSIHPSTPSSGVRQSRLTRSRLYPIARPRVLASVPAALLPTRPTPAPRPARSIIPPLHPVRPLIPPTPAPRTTPQQQPPAQTTPQQSQPAVAKDVLPEDAYATQAPTKKLEILEEIEGIGPTKKMQRFKEQNDTQKKLLEKENCIDTDHNSVKKSSDKVAKNMHPFEVQLQSSQPAKLILASGKDKHGSSTISKTDLALTPEKNPVLSIRSGFNKEQKTHNNTPNTAPANTNTKEVPKKMVTTTSTQKPNVKSVKETPVATTKETISHEKTITTPQAAGHSSIIQSITNVLLQTVVFWGALIAPVASMVWNTACTLLRAL